jgi:hypothetical protein
MTNVCQSHGLTCLELWKVPSYDLILTSRHDSKRHDVLGTRDMITLLKDVKNDMEKVVMTPFMAAERKLEKAPAGPPAPSPHTWDGFVYVIGMKDLMSAVSIESPAATQGGRIEEKGEGGAASALSSAATGPASASSPAAPPRPWYNTRSRCTRSGTSRRSMKEKSSSSSSSEGGGAGGGGGGGNVVHEHAATVASRTKQRLMALKILLNDGTISQADFSAQKCVILSSI